MNSRSPRVDLRSDTLTRPSPAMRRVMAEAEVGDDVFGEDPTVNHLQERAAELLGKEAALLVPSGTMGNQLALLSHCRRGDDVIVGQYAHTYSYESGAGAVLAGVQFTVLPTPTFDGQAVAANIKGGDAHLAPTTLVAVENTHNRSGGRVFSSDALLSIRSICDEHGLLLHMDGARVFNAAVAVERPVAEVVACADSVTFCLSKGLGCPVGSVLAGTRQFIATAHRYRKMLGGGMRQAGVLAAAGLYALEHNVDRLADDHGRAQRFARALADASPAVTVEPADTNIVVFHLGDGLMTGKQFQDRAAEAGLMVFAMGPQTVRAVFHLDIDDALTNRAIEVAREIIDTAQNP